MERFFIFDDYNTFRDWDLILTSKTIDNPEVKTYLVDIDGIDGSIDLTESLTGGPVYKDRKISATFWTDHGKRSDRVRLLQKIRSALHGRKIKIVEPDDPDHYFIGRVNITDEVNNLAYAEIKIEALCDPYRYNIETITRSISNWDNSISNIVITNTGDKMLTPTIEITGTITLICRNVTVTLNAGTYIVSDIKLYKGSNTIQVSGSGTIKFHYHEGYI